MVPGMPADDFTFVLYPITFPITMRDDIRAPCASVCKGKAIQAPLQGKRKSQFKNSCPIVHGAWAKGRAKASPRCTVHRDRLPWGTKTATVGIFAVLAFPISFMQTGRSGRDFLLHEESSQCGASGSYSNPFCPPACPSLPLLPVSEFSPCRVSWRGAGSGAWRDKPTQGPRRDKSCQTQTAKAQLQVLFPVEKELAEVTGVFQLPSCDFPRAADLPCDGSCCGALL